MRSLRVWGKWTYCISQGRRAAVTNSPQVPAAGHHKGYFSLMSRSSERRRVGGALFHSRTQDLHPRTLLSFRGSASFIYGSTSPWAPAPATAYPAPKQRRAANAEVNVGDLGSRPASARIAGAHRPLAGTQSRGPANRRGGWEMQSNCVPRGDEETGVSLLPKVPSNCCASRGDGFPGGHSSYVLLSLRTFRHSKHFAQKASPFHGAQEGSEG